MSLALNYVDGPEEGTLWPPALLPGSEGLHTLICYFRTDTVLENTLTDVRKHWRRKELKSLCVLYKIIVVKFVIALDPFKDTKALWREKGDWVEGLMCCPGDWECPHSPPQQELVLLWAFSSSGFSNRSLAGFGEEEHTIQHSPPVPSFPFSG